MRFNIFLAMLFCHVIADYNLQGCLADMKQKSWWRRELAKLKLDLEQTHYKNDYKMALCVHGFSWSVISMSPLVYLCWESCPWRLFWFVLWNAAFHAMVDHLKANAYLFNLIEDQLLHVLQLAGTFWVFFKYIKLG